MRKDPVATAPHIGSGAISTEKYFPLLPGLWQC